MVEFLAPVGWLVASAALLPIGAAVLRARREGPVRRRLGLQRPGPAARAATVVAATLAIVLLAAATARPAVRTTGTHSLRTDAEVYFVVDISRSMLARLPDGKTRFRRAIAAAEALRSRLANVPAGVASITDRPLPHLFPTGDEHVFSAVLHHSIGIQRPPAESGRDAFGLTTSFDPLAELATAGYFAPKATHRVVILLTDGESNLYSPDAIATQFRAEHIGLLIVRFWNAHERVYTPNGRIEPYRPEVQSLRPLRRLAARTPGGQLFGEGELKQAVAAARAWLGHGPSRRIGRPRRFELAPYAALAAVLPIAFLLRRRDP